MEVNYCPNCGTNLRHISTFPKSLAQTEQNRVGTIRQNLLVSDYTGVHIDPNVNTVEASVAQPRESAPLTTAEKVKVQELHKSGLSWARIREAIERPDAPLSAIMAANRIPKNT